jgi:ribosomal protein L13E
MAIPDISFYTTAEVATLRTAVVAERLRRATGGTITSANKNGRQFTVESASESELAGLEQALARRLNTGGANKRRISFN